MTKSQLFAIVEIKLFRLTITFTNHINSFVIRPEKMFTKELQLRQTCLLRDIPESGCF